MTLICHGYLGSLLCIFTTTFNTFLMHIALCDRLSKKPDLFAQLKFFLLFTQQYQQCPRNGPPQFQPSVVLEL